MSSKPSAPCDFIVIGGGSAGWVIASRLSRQFHVLLVEAGMSETGSSLIRRPADYVKCFGGESDWGFSTAPQIQLDQRRLRFPRGKGLGGSTRINASIWLRPLAQCVQRLAAVTGGHISDDRLAQALDLAEFNIAPEAPRWLSESARRFLEAAANEGFSAAQFQRMNHRGHRTLVNDVHWETTHQQDTSRTVQVRSNGSSTSNRDGSLTVLTDVVVDRLLVNHRQVVGIEYLSCNQRKQVAATAGVVLSAGAIGTPAILQRSGFGPAHVLKQAGIPPRADLPNIGANLSDHLVMPVIAGLNPSVSALTGRDTVRSLPGHWTPHQLAQWRAVGTGPVASNLAEAGGFHGEGEQLFQLFITATDYLRHPQPNGEPTEACTIGVVPAYPLSRGAVNVTSAAPLQPPSIDPAYLSQEADFDTLLTGIARARELFSQPQFSKWISAERTPGSKRTDRASLQKAARKWSQTLYHPVGTCHFGKLTDAPVDEHFRFRELDHLWVCDASVLPFPVAANPNALVTALAIIAADEIGCVV